MNNKATAYQAQQRNALLQQHSPLVKRIAHHLKGRLPEQVAVDDLIQAGMIGLLEATKNFDSSKGASFETFAGIRIRGSMLDEVRRNDWAPRSVHQNSRKISEAIHQIEQQTGQDARDTDVAEKLNVSLVEYQQMLADTNNGRILGIDDLGVPLDQAVERTDDENDDPFEQLSLVNFHEALVANIKQLPEREALVLSLYYDEELNLREIGDVLSVSESRVCQIHSQAMHRLKAKLSSWRTEA